MTALRTLHSAPFLPADQSATTGVTTDAWLQDMRRDWQQGEHVVIIGSTGSGKTTIARYLLCARDYVIVLAVKRHDDTLGTFKKPHETDPAYRVLKKWPVPYDCNKAVIWFRPEHLKNVSDQALQVYDVLDKVFVAGGWCIYVDDTGYVTGTLKLHAAITVLLNQGRSSGISVVTAITQATSMVARVPSETLRQVRHVIVFPYYNKKDLDAISIITGEDMATLRNLMPQLDKHDFLYFYRGRQPVIVRNTRKAA